MRHVVPDATVVSSSGSPMNVADHGEDLARCVSLWQPSAAEIDIFREREKCRGQGGRTEGFFVRSRTPIVSTWMGGRSGSALPERALRWTDEAVFRRRLEVSRLPPSRDGAWRRCRVAVGARVIVTGL